MTREPAPSLPFRIAGAGAMVCGGIGALRSLAIAQVHPDAGVLFGVSLLVFVAGLWCWIHGAGQPQHVFRRASSSGVQKEQETQMASHGAGGDRPLKSRERPMDRTVKFAIVGACAAIVLLVLYVIFAPVMQRWQMERQLERQLEQMFGNVQEQAEQHTRTGIRT